MRNPFKSDFFRRFAGGFALGAVALAVSQAGAVGPIVTASVQQALTAS